MNAEEWNFEERISTGAATWCQGGQPHPGKLATTSGLARRDLGMTSETHREEVTMSDNNPKEAIKNDWEQTKSDVPGLEGKDIDQDVDDTLKQAAGKEDTDNS